MVSAKKKIAIIGMSEAGRKHLSELKRSDYFELVGIYDKNLKEDFGKIDLYNDLDRLFGEKNPETIVISVAQNLHKSLILKAVKYVKNILIDAPLALNLEESREIKYATKNSDTGIAIFYKDRFNPTATSLLKEFAKGDKIYTMNFVVGKNSENRCDINENLLLQELDLARVLSGSEMTLFQSKTILDENGKVGAIGGVAKSKNDILITMICSNFYSVLRHFLQISTQSGVYLADLINFTLHKMTPNGAINLKVDNENFCCRYAHKEFFEFCESGVLKRLASIDEAIKVREILQ